MKRTSITFEIILEDKAWEAILHRSSREKDHPMNIFHRDMKKAVQRIIAKGNPLYSKRFELFHGKMERVYR